MPELPEVAAQVRQGLAEMAATLRAIDQPDLANWAEKLGMHLGDAIYEAMGNTSLDIRLGDETLPDATPIEELAVVADKMRRLRLSLKRN